MSKSICCNFDTKIGYFNTDQRHDLYPPHGDHFVPFGVMGTYCVKCDKLCDYKVGKTIYNTNGIKKVIHKNI